MLDEQLLCGGAEKIDGGAQVLGRLEQVPVHLAGQDVSGAKSHGRSASLGHLTQDNAKVGDGVLHGALQLL